MINKIQSALTLCSTIRICNKFDYNIGIRYANKHTQKSQGENKRIGETKKKNDNQMY